MGNEEFLKSLFTDRNSAVQEFLKQPETPIDDGGKAADQKYIDSRTVEAIMKTWADNGNKEVAWYLKHKGYSNKLGAQ